MNKDILKLYFIMGSNNTEKDPVSVLKKAIQGGITCFQFREKGKGALAGGAKEELARRLQEVCADNDIPFIINDDVELALRLRADGIHAGQNDAPASEIRKYCPAGMLVGISAKTLREARKAEQDGADYIGTGPMFATATKEDAEEPIGPAGISRIRAQGFTLPIVGIGGIHVENAVQVIKAGADGISVISAISAKDNPEQAARRLLEAVMKD
ncbi:thiamine phosphate synthase [Alteribacillus sp. HJP-4]|uniref:thiamine phosphate synthase n=1 Tax=Alteribacillus sp. HJP-4 TaxID=2775394 RepID=UPI0035CD1897